MPRRDLVLYVTLRTLPTDDLTRDSSYDSTRDP
jgi:hypothetical protein